MNPPTPEPWRLAHRQFAADLCAVYAARPGVLGVAIGGSVARGTEWKHSDVEIGLLVGSPLPEVGHFNMVGQRGYEVFQLAHGKWHEKIDRAAGDPIAVVDWPIQLFECRVVHDPTGFLGRFKSIFDAALLRPDVMVEKARRELTAFDKALATARADSAAGRPFSALHRVRQALNSLVLAFYWDNRRLPRSQNRAEHLLREICEAVGRPEVHALFVDAYGVEPFDEVGAREQLRAARREIERVTIAWGDAAPAFFEHACDGNLAWNYGRSILAVHRLYLPQCIRAAGDGGHATDDPAWRAAHAPLSALLGLSRAAADGVPSLIERAEQVRNTISARQRSA